MFYEPFGVSVDSGTNLYVVDSDVIRKVTLTSGTWMVTTIGGTQGLTGTAGGIGSAARFNAPEGIAVNGSGGLFVADTSNSRIALGAVMQPPNITSALSATGTNGTAFIYTITADTYPTSFNATGFGSGLSVDTVSGLISGTPSSSGTFSLAISASNIAGSGSASLTLSILSAYQAWQALMFSPSQLAKPAISGDLATPAGDGITNLMKYALNLNPWVSNTSGMPFRSITPVSGGSYLTLTVVTNLNFTFRPDITYTPQVSTDLKTWNSGASYTVGPTITPNLDGVTQSISYRSVVPIDSNTPKQFIRLQITGQ